MKTCSNILIICVAILLPIMSACVYRVGEEEMMTGGCNNPDPVSYANDVVPVLSGSCLGCHDARGNAGGIVFDSYAGVKAIVDDGRLIGSINHNAGFEAMPRNASKLPECTLRLIQDWVNSGAPDN